MIVVDAGVWVRSLVDADESGDACRVAMTADPDWAAPSHAALEVLRTIRRYETAGLIKSTFAEACAESVGAAEVRYVGPEPWMLHATWQIRHNVSIYDAPYVVLARRFDAVLTTLDQRLSRAAMSLGVSVAVPQ